MADEPLPGPDSGDLDEIGLLPFDEDAENEYASRHVDPVAKSPRYSAIGAEL